MNCNNPLVTVIVPVYKVEPYLRRCLDSIVNQTYKNLEIILIDDGSPDNCGVICDEYAENDKRIKVIHKENGGVSRARNEGINVAKGEYIAFVDSDDYIEPDLVEKSCIAVEKSGSDFLKFGIFEEYYKSNGELLSREEVTPDNFIVNTKNEIYDRIVELEQVPLFGYMCNSIYRKSRIKSTRVNPDIKVNEDFDYNIRYVKNITCMEGISYCGYHYAKRANASVSTRKNPNYYVDHMRKIAGLIDLYNGVQNMPISIRSKVFWLYTRFIYSTLERNLASGADKEAFDTIRQDIKYKLFKETAFVDLSLKQKVMIYLLKTGNFFMLESMVRIIALAKSKLPVVFSRIKR